MAKPVLYSYFRSSCSWRVRIANLAVQSPPPQTPSFGFYSGRKSVKIGGISVSVVKGKIQEEKADVIVNCTAPDLDLSKGRITSALTRAAGNSLQDECNEQYEDGIEEGDVAITKGGKLKCKRVYHVMVPKWTSGGEEAINKALGNALAEAQKYGVTSLASSPLGTGYLNYKPDVIATEMFQAVRDFVKQNSSTTVKYITFVVFTADAFKSVYDALEAEARKIGANVAAQSPTSSSPIKTSSGGNSTRKSVNIEGISVCVVKGNIQEEKVNVIVNCAASDLDLSKGRITNAISRAAGKSLQDECNENYDDGIKEGEVAITRGGNLNCNRVYHVTLPVWEEGGEEAISTALRNVLSEAQKYGVISLASSPLGTGYLNYTPDVIAAQMFKAVTDFVKQNSSTTIKNIAFIVYESAAFKSVYEALEAEARRISGSTQTSSTRGTKEYFKHLYKKPLHPPCYWTHYDDSKSLQDWNLQHKEVKLVSVDKTTETAIKKLVTDTWKSQLVGHGRDAAGLDTLGYKNIQIKNIKRVENPVLFEKYAQHRADMFRKAGKIGSFKQLENIPCVQEGPILTTLKCDSVLKQDMFPEVNEHYLFHGTGTDKVDVIVSQGLDFRLATNPVLGKGAYAAESSTKADQYADPATNRDKTSDKKMILLRMCLGEIYVINQIKSFKRPPCKTCQNDNCIDMDHGKNGLFNSVAADKIWNFREFVVYERSMCYPEYVITYVRI